MLKSLISAASSASTASNPHPGYVVVLFIRIQRLSIFPDCVFDDERNLKEFEVSCSLGDSRLAITDAYLDKTSIPAAICWNNANNTLRWSFSDDQWKKLKASTQRVKLVVKFADKSASLVSTLGWVMIDLKTIPSSEEVRTVRLQGKLAGSSEISFSVMLSNRHHSPSPSTHPEIMSHSPRPLINSSLESKDILDDDNFMEEPHPLPQPIIIRKPSFLIFTMQSAYNLHDSLPSSNVSYWLSCCLIHNSPDSTQFKSPPIIVQTQKFSDLTNPRFPSVSLSFSLSSSSSSIEADLTGVELHAFLCSDNGRFISRGVVTDLHHHLDHILMIDLMYDEISVSASMTRAVLNSSSSDVMGTVVMGIKLSDHDEVKSDVSSVEVIQPIIQQQQDVSSSSSVAVKSLASSSVPPKHVHYWQSHNYFHDASSSSAYRLTYEIIALCKLTIQYSGFIFVKLHHKLFNHDHSIQSKPFWFTSSSSPINSNSISCKSSSTRTINKTSPQSFFSHLSSSPVMLTLQTIESNRSNSISFGSCLLNLNQYDNNDDDDGEVKGQTCRGIVTDVRLRSKTTGRICKYNPDDDDVSNDDDDVSVIWVSDTIQPLTNDDGKMIGGIHVRIILEDLGNDDDDDQQEEEDDHRVHKQQHPHQHQQSPASPPSSSEVVLLSSKLSIEQQMREWENWRHDEEMTWTRKLKTLEEELRQRLDYEYQDKMEKKLVHLMSSEKEVEVIEGRLKSSMALVEERERQLILKEEKMKASYMTKMNELQLVQRRSREECRSRIELETGKMKAMEQEVKLMANQLQRSERRAVQAEDEYDQLKAVLKKSPEDGLRIEISRLQGQKAEIQARLDVETSTRQRYESDIRQLNMTNAQLLSALHQEQTKTQSDTRQELEMLRMQYLKREEKFVLDGDLAELKQIKLQVDMLVDDDAGDSDKAVKSALSQFNLYDAGEDLMKHLSQHVTKPFER